MILVLLDGERMKIVMGQNIGSLEILGEAIGEKEETSDLLEVRTILVSSQHAHGLLQLILGLMILETKPSQKKKIGCPKNSFQEKRVHAEGNHQKKP